MRKRHKQILSLTVAVAISAVCLFFFLRELNFANVWAKIRQAHVGWMALSLTTIWLSMVARGFRWRVLLADVKPISPVRLYHMQMIGITATGIMPGRLGEFIKAIFLSQKSAIPFTSTFATVVVERILDLALVVTLTVTMLLVFPFPTTPVELPGFDEPTTITALLRKFGIVSGAVCTVMILGTLALVFYPATFVRLVTRMVGLVSVKLGDFLGGLLQSFTSGLGVFRSPTRAAASLAWTAAVWAGILLSEYVLFKSFGIEVGLLGAALLTAALALAVALPQAPGFIGVFQLATTMVLVHCFGVPKDAADAYAIVLWFVQMGCLIALGFVSLFVEGVSFAAHAVTKRR